MKYTQDMLFKVLDEHQASMHGGTGKWVRGKRRVVRGPLVPCENGIHLCCAQNLVRWLGPQIWIAKPYGSRIDANDKIVVRGATIISRVRTWNETTARLFAADVAEQALKAANVKLPVLFATIKAARSFARGQITKEALSAAENAARSAAWSAARSAAESAAQSAARSAAQSATWSAAESAAQSAAWSAARSVAQSAQTIILFEYLNGIRT